jgi:TRAP-type uncharacterized transport system substrate-binding protein
MLNDVRSLGLRISAAIVCLVAVVWLALWYFIPAPPSSITIAAGLQDGAFEHIALRYRERLARHHVKLNVRITEGSLDTVRLLHDPKSGVAAGFLFGGFTNSTLSPWLISLGRIDYAPIWIFYRSAETLDRLTQLSGKRVAISRAVSQLGMEILAAHDVNPNNTALTTLAGPAAAKALKDGQVDVVLLPQALDAPNVQLLLRDHTVKLMSVTQAEAMTRLFPVLHRLILPHGVVDLANNIPDRDVELIASTNVVVARNDVHPELLYLLARTMQEEHGTAGIFHRAGEFPTQIDPEFPVAEEAVDYYKNGPPFLQRYLPFWMINYAKRVAAILVAAIAIVIPLFTFTPKLYAWLLNLRLARLYRRLRAVNANLKKELSADQVAALQSDLDHIDRAANILPMRHSDLFFALLMHIDMTRTRLASRLAELRDERRVA